jgi:Predicted metal-dependent hydrolase with the TIM- barrel fold
MDAIRMCTIWAARAALLEESRGSIEVGKLADLVVLSADPLTTSPRELPTVAVESTILGGKVVYQRH